MRSFAALIVISTLLCGAAAAEGEWRVFLVANNADGYGVDRCLASGASCGAPAAAAYCQSRDFSRAASYRKVDRAEITGSVPAHETACRGNACEQLIAIVCTR